MITKLISSRCHNSLIVLLLVTACSVSLAQEESQSAAAKPKPKPKVTETETETAAETAAVRPVISQPMSGEAESEFSDRLQLEKKPSVPTGRLPRFFAAVVDQQQRLQIYEIQHAYRVKLDALERQLAELLALQVKEIEQVLTPSQLQTVEELRSKPRSLAASTEISQPISP